MSKMSTDLVRHALNGPTMGTRWSAIVYAAPDLEPARLRAALAAAVGDVDRQMSTWSEDSDLMRLNRAETGRWVDGPAGLLTVLDAGLAIGRASGGAFDMGLGDAVRAWGFGAAEAAEDRIRAALHAPRRPTYEVLEIDIARGRARKHAPLVLDLGGIAKGFGVDRLTETACSFGIAHALLSIDGELRALGSQPGGAPWCIGVERPDHGHRAAHSVLTLGDAAVATSGDYRHWIDLGGRRWSHTMDPARGAPLADSPASVTVVAPTCLLADAWATAMMVLGRDRGSELAQRLGLSVLFLDRDGAQLAQTRTGPVFAAFGQPERPAAVTPPA
ncbi:FAD:protein FMN transferase [Tropicimonas sp. IMCC6043]|uniref:FAD:protein FMN transferase n=1 Tax=Tropicimonas sp. IMCC6043 TaxID=2510645 RepID=UPI00101BA6A1|nr:FAD:protein FMN transferase [Tropicimonas sp. IMCC6043]RYH09041.1 FAD:protein FMN transferase [Tropicimonas sp. IMCC6043]